MKDTFKVRITKQYLYNLKDVYTVRASMIYNNHWKIVSKKDHDCYIPKDICEIVKEFKVGDRVAAHKDWESGVGTGPGTVADEHTGLGLEYDWSVKLDSGKTWAYYNNELTHLEDTMEEEYTDSKGQTWEQLRPITLNALMEAGAQGSDVDALFNSSFFVAGFGPTKRLGYVFELDTIIDYASSCNDKLHWLVDNTQWRKEGDKFSGFIRRVEKKYEVKLGDKYTIKGQQYILGSSCSDGKWMLLISLKDGSMWNEEFPIDNNPIEILKKVFGNTINWKKVYATRVPYEGE